MIQINLLPEEFRPTDGNVLPMFFTFVIGCGILGVLGVYWVVLTQQVSGLEIDKGKKESTLREWRKKEKTLNKLIKEIKESQSRQQTIIKISASKIVWSAKLAQLSSICSQFKNVWIDSVRMNQDGLKGSMTIDCNLMSSISGEISNFNAAIQSNRLFWYHFKRLESSREVRIEQGKNNIPPVHWKFSPTLILNDDKQ